MLITLSSDKLNIFLSKDLFILGIPKTGHLYTYHVVTFECNEWMLMKIFQHAAQQLQHAAQQLQLNVYK